MANQVKRPFLSVVSPVYKAESVVDELVQRLRESLDAVAPDYEIILVEDRSPDGSWEKIVENCLNHSFVKGIRLSRNFGQHNAITAGLMSARGEYVVVMDCDLQDNPKYIVDLLGKAREGYDIVYTYKKNREHSLFKNLTGRLFVWIFNYLTDNNDNRSNLQVGAFSLLSRKAVDAFCRIKDFHRHYLMVVRLLGFSHTHIVIEHEKRFAGTSSYSFSKLVQHAINGITSQSVRLLNFSIGLGFFLFAGSLLWAFYLVIRYFEIGAYPGYTSTMAMLLLSTGLILMSIGITGIYLAKVFEQVKERPLYFIDETLNIDKE